MLGLPLSMCTRGRAERGFHPEKGVVGEISGPRVYVEKGES